MNAVGSYRILERLGEGGMGEVFRAVDTMLEREVALKTLRPQMSAREDLVERFRVEAIALARLHHRHIAAVYAFFEEGGRYHIAMQFVRGRTLEAQLQQRGRLPWREAAAVAMDVLHALEHAHALGVVHRDLKPANLMVDDEGRTVVMDFGIARVLARDRQTRAGTLVGTLEYIAPEIVKGEVADARADIYALGCVLYEMVTGQLPFHADSDFALMRAHAEQAPARPSVRAGDLPPALEALILRALEKDPARRFADARAFIEALAAATGIAPEADAADTTTRSSKLPRLPAELVRWLDLPRNGGWPAWRSWLGANLGLAGAAAVGVVAVLLVTGMAGYSACCSRTPTPQVHIAVKPVAPVASAPVAQAPSPAPAPAPTPVAWAPAEPAPAPAPSVSLDRPAPFVMPPPPKARVSIERSAPPPAASPTAPTPAATPAPAPPPPGWYVKR